jgi:ribonuclease T2
VPLYPPLAKFARRAALAAVVACAAPASAQDKAGDFDFYVLALGWAPGICAALSYNSEQCDGHGFVVHGLWPEYERGYPEYCETKYPTYLPRRILNSVEDLMPDGGIVGYQWRKHGVCSGLAPEDYFDLLRAAAEKIRLPDSIAEGDRQQSLTPAKVEAAFVSANPGLTTRGMGIECAGNRLTEVRICMTKDLEFRSCPSVDGDSCRAGSISVPAIR